MKAQGIYSEVNTEVGQIIVADVNTARIAELLEADRTALRQLISKEHQPCALATQVTTGAARSRIEDLVRERAQQSAAADHTHSRSRRWKTDDEPNERMTHDSAHDEHALDDELEPRLTPDRPRLVSDADRRRFEGYLAEILTALGLDLDTPGTSLTPRRFLRALFDSTSGHEGDPKLLTAFPTECRGGANCETAQVVEGPIPFFALCEHHALPFFGDVYVGYVAHEGIIGISKLARLVRVVTRRFGVQERMTYQIGEELDRMMAPHGVAVYVEAHHLCTQMRGVRELYPKTRTTSYHGVYVDSPQLRGESLRRQWPPSRGLLTAAARVRPAGEAAWVRLERLRPPCPTIGRAGAG